MGYFSKWFGTSWLGLSLVTLGVFPVPTAQAQVGTSVTIGRTYKGLVSQAEGGAPQPGTTVTIRRIAERAMMATRMPEATDFEDLATTLSDNSGRYELGTTFTAANPYAFTWVEARTTAGLIGSGFSQQNRMFGASGSESVTLPVDIKVRPVGVIEGRVVDDFEKPGTSITVGLSRVVSGNMFDPTAAQTATTVTNSRGEFRFPNALQGFQYSVSIHQAGYEPVSAEVKCPSTGTLLRLRQGGASIAGFLRDFETRKPVPNTTISLMLVPGNNRGRMIVPKSQVMTTNELGEFELGGLSGGQYFVSVAKKGYEIMPNEGSIKPLNNGPSGFQLQSNETTSGLEIFVFSGYTVEGLITDPDNKPVEGVEVTTLWQGAQHPDGDSRQDVTGANGRYQVKMGATTMYRSNNLPMGFVRVKKAGWVRVLGEGERQNGGQPDTYQFPMEPGKIRYSGIDVVMEPALTVNGRVVNASGAPVPHAEVKMWADRNHSWDQNWPKADAKGYFTFEVMKDRSVRVEARSLSVGYGRSDLITVDDRPTTIPDIVLSPWARISGIVVDPQDKPVAQAQINGYGLIQVGNNGYGSNLLGMPAISNDAGKFTINTIPPNDQINLSASASGFADSKREQLTLQSGEAREDLRLQLQTPQSISGRVLDWEKKPVVGANINAHQSNGGNSSNSTTDAEGKFTLSDLGAGTYDVYVWHQSSNASKRGVKAGTTDLELILAKPANAQRAVNPDKKILLKGTVVDAETKKPISGITVKESYGSNGLSIGTSPDVAGEFTAEASAGQSARLRISAPNYAPLVTDYIQFTKSEELIERTFELEKGRTVSGRIVDSDKKPLADVRVRLLLQGEAWQAFQTDPVATVRTSADGKFEFQSLRSGLQRLDIRPQSPLVALTHSFTVETGSGIQDLGDVVVGTGGSVRARVRTKSGEGVANCRVMIYESSSGSQNRREQSTNKEGIALIERVTPGEYGINVMVDNRYSVGISKTIKVELDKTVEVDLTVGTAVLPGKLLQGTDGVSGYITARAKAGEGTRFTAQADNSGDFEFGGLVPGEYDIEGQSYGISGRSGQVRATVTVREGRNDEVILRLPAAKISGTVVDTEGKPVSGARVSAANSRPATADDSYLQYNNSVETGEDGSFEFAGLNPGVYGLTANKEGVGFALQPNNQLPQENSKLEGVKLVLKKEGGTLISIALDIETGRGIPEAWCYLSNEQGRYPHSATRKADGTMTIENIPAGKYTVQISSFGYSSEEKPVEIVKDQTARLESVLYVAGALRWQLQAGAGVSLNDVELTLTPDDPQSIEEPRSGKPDRQGLWVVRGLAPGPYTGTVKRAGKPDIVVKATVIRREVQSLNTPVNP